MTLNTALWACKKHHENGICTCGKVEEKKTQIEYPKQKRTNYR